jgi:hypothetical protein
MKWAVEIQKTSLAVRNLSDLLDGLGFQLVHEGNCPALTAPALDACESASGAYSLAKKVRAAFTGPAGVDPDFELGCVLDYSAEPPLRHAFLEAKTVGLTVSVGSPTLTVGPPKGLTEQEVRAWKEEQAEKEYQHKLESQRKLLEPAFREERAAKILSLLSDQELTGERIYKIYETAEGHPKNRKSFQAQFGISEETFLRFNDAVHNPRVTGDWARHAYDHPPRSRQPMSKSEAETFVRKVAELWLEHIRTSHH